jgi:hypothetical protein
MDSIELLDVKSKKAKEYRKNVYVREAVQVILFLEQLFCSVNCERVRKFIGKNCELVKIYRIYIFYIETNCKGIYIYIYIYIYRIYFDKLGYGGAIPNCSHVPTNKGAEPTLLATLPCAPFITEHKIEIFSLRSDRFVSM